jgi:hypothetical protein
VPDWVPGLISSSKEVSTPDRAPFSTSLSSVGITSTVPSAAAVIGTEIVQCRSLPCLSKVGCSATLIST